MSLRDDEQLIQDALDLKLDARRFAAFEDRLRRDPELRRLYLSYSRIDGLLGEKYRDSEGSIVALPARRRPARIAAWAALAACLLALGVAVPLLVKDQPAALVEIGPESHGRVLHATDRGEASSLRPGSRIELEHGSASISLAAGGRAYFEGPGTLEMISTDTFRLGEGRVWFESEKPLACLTDTFEVKARASEFGVIATNHAELHVIAGELAVHTPDGADATLAAGRSARWDGDTLLTADTATAFTTGFPRSVLVFAEDFSEPDLTPLSGKLPDTGPGPWYIEYGGPLIENSVLDTSGNVRHMAFAPLGDPVLDELSHVLLLTLETEDPATSRFHSAGWAGVSLYTGDQERIFVGDPCGPAEGWALHPAGYSARNACPLLHGKTTVTLRYDFRTGLAQLFEGTDTTGPALASEWIEPGLQFDRLRIANGSQADAAIDAGKPASAAGEGPEIEVRGDIALRNIRLSILSSDSRSVATQP